MSETALVRPFSLSPSRNLTKHNSNHRIFFLHPAYPDHNNELLNLSAFDRLDAGPRGLHAGTAFLACAIIAGNSWTGYLTALTRDGTRVQHQTDEILCEEQYYFLVPKPNDDNDLYYQHPITPSFRH